MPTAARACPAPCTAPALLAPRIAENYPSRAHNKTWRQENERTRPGLSQLPGTPLPPPTPGGYKGRRGGLQKARRCPKWPAPAGSLPGRGCRGYIHSFGKRTYKPNSVVCGHSSRRRVAADAHQRPTRRFRQLLKPPGRIGPMRSAAWLFSGASLPIWSCSVWGLPCPGPYGRGRCALAAPFHPYPGAGVSATTSVPGKPGQLGYCVSREALSKEG